jgi:hypothetical protein
MTIVVSALGGAFMLLLSIIGYFIVRTLNSMDGKFTTLFGKLDELTNEFTALTKEFIKLKTEHDVRTNCK